MEFLKTYYRADLLDEAKDLYTETVAVFAQLDVWDTHVFIVFPEADEFQVCMFNARNPEKGTPATVEDMAEAFYDGEDDSAPYLTLGAALDAVTGGYGNGIEGLPADLQKAYDEAANAS